MTGKIKNYTAKVYLELDVQAQGKRQVRDAIKAINWETDIHYRRPLTGFLTDWALKAKGDAVEIIEIEES